MARLNENENENENEGTGGGRSGLFAGSRYNTYKIAKQAFNPGGDMVRPSQTSLSPGYDEMGGWDPENKAWVYIRDFVLLRPNWFQDSKTAAGPWNGWKRSTVAERTASDNALRQIIDAAGEREDRFAEILHQQDAEGCITYWEGMLGIDRAKHPNTYQLIRLGRKIGEMVVMCLKAEFNAARPSQICPAIVPMFDPPRTAAYPAGHALQSYLISYLLLRVMPRIPQSPKPTSWATPHEGLFALARRVSDNRVIGGVHFDIDNEAGFLIAREIDSWFDAWDVANPTEFGNFRGLLVAAADEFPQFK